MKVSIIIIILGFATREGALSETKEYLIVLA
jgi:hypothetical protein